MARVANLPRAGYAVIPRFALSASEPLLEVCRALLKENPSAYFTSHINESPQEIEIVAELFPWAKDYLDVYEKFDLIGRRSVLAHNVHASDSEIQRLAKHGASVAHCPCSNAALGSGIFPMCRHLNHNAHFALGTDVGGGTGFGMLREALQSHLLQRLAVDPLSITPAQMLYLATRAGAEALQMDSSLGDFTVGKHADYVVIRPRSNTALTNVLKSSPDPERTLGALFTLAEAEDIREVRVGGDVVHENR
jgi:guanine deaminase